MEHISNALERCLTGPPSETPVVTLPPDDDSATIFYNLPPEPPLEAFPAEIRQMLRQASVSFKHAPIEVPLVGFLSLLSICIGRSRALEVKEILTGRWRTNTAKPSAALKLARLLHGWALSLSVLAKKRGKELSSHLLKVFKAGHNVSTCRQRRNH